MRLNTNFIQSTQTNVSDTAYTFLESDGDLHLNVV